MSDPSRIWSHPADTVGLARLARAASDQAELTRLYEDFIARLTEDPEDAGALMDLSTLLLLIGHREKALELQTQALSKRRCYRRSYGSGAGLRILVFMIAGDLMANTPLDFLLEPSDASLHLAYIDGPPPPPSMLPDHDLALLAIGQSDAADPVLLQLEEAMRAWPRPVVNGRPDRILALTRDAVAAAFAGHPKLIAPATRRLPRDGVVEACDAGAFAFPQIIRPVDSHAGNGLQKLEDRAALAAYLAESPAGEFYLADFVDYSGVDGNFRKLRIVFVEGRPFIAHMAISARWMVHYLNADMDENAGHRAEEAEMMATFDEGFAARHAEAFAALCDTIGLDYFGIDCAETTDGRLLMFEADTGMIVHAMDPPERYPYKQPAMTKLFSGFLAGLESLAVARREAA